MRRDEPLPADFRINNASGAPARSRWGTSLEFVLSLLAVVAFFQLKPALERWLEAKTEAVETSALGQCRPPAEFEQLHVVVVNRAGRLVAGECLYVGTPGSYVR